MLLNIRIGLSVNKEVLMKRSGNKNPVVVDEDPLFTQSSMSSPLVFDSVNTNIYFSLLNDSNTSGAVDYVAQIYTKISYSIHQDLRVPPENSIWDKVVYPEKNPHRHLNVLLERLFSTDSVDMISDCFPTTVSQLFPPLSKASDNPLKDKTQKKT